MSIIEITYYHSGNLPPPYEIKWIPLGSCCKIIKGEYLTKKDAASGTIPVILGGQQPAYFIDRANHCGNAIVVSRSGASAGFVSWWDEPIFVTDGFLIEPLSGLQYRFLYYVMKNMQVRLNGMKRGSGVPHITSEMLLGIILPVPSAKEQDRIVSILDKFEALNNSLTSGLPAEIKARQQQYEYYRDKLLTFPRRAC